MSLLIFGIIWTVITTLVAVPMCLGGINLFLGLFFLLFYGIGITMITIGARTIHKNNMTKKYGIPCYGIVLNVVETGTYVNGAPEYKAEVQIMNPETSNIETIYEIIGFDPLKYPINSYVQCKYYNGDINLEGIISADGVPSTIREHIVPIAQTAPQNAPSYMDLTFSADRSIVTIDGVQYKRIDY